MDNQQRLLTDYSIRTDLTRAALEPESSENQKTSEIL
jgi:hypothetical protein